MSNPKRIQVGDKVFVMYPGHANTRSFPGIVHHIPAATGDSWIIESTGKAPGEIYYISEPVTFKLLEKRQP